MIILLIVCFLSFFGFHFHKSVKKQHLRESEWIKKYKYIPDGFCLTYCKKSDRMVLLPLKKLSRDEWFKLPDHHRSLVKLDKPTI